MDVKELDRVKESSPAIIAVTSSSSPSLFLNTTSNKNDNDEEDVCQDQLDDSSSSPSNDVISALNVEVDTKELIPTAKKAIAINEDIHNDDVNNEEFDFSALRAKLAQKAESTTTKKLNIVVTLDDHYKSQREKKLLELKKKNEAKEYLKSFQCIANNANTCEGQQEVAVADADADADAESMELQLPVLDGEDAERIDSSRQVEFSDGQESKQDPVSDLPRGLVEVQVESGEFENQHECEHAIAGTEGAEPCVGQCSDIVATREGTAINNMTSDIPIEKDSTLQQSVVETETVDIVSDHVHDQEGTTVNNTAIANPSENGSPLHQSQQRRVGEVLNDHIDIDDDYYTYDIHKIPLYKHLLVPPQRKNYFKIFQACGCSCGE